MHSHQHSRDDDDDDDDDDRDTQSPGSGTGLGDRTWHLPLPEICPTEYCLPENDYRGRLSLVTVGIQSYRWVWGLELLLALGVELLWLGVRIRVRS